jgi:hypothetical protein
MADLMREDGFVHISDDGGGAAAIEAFKQRAETSASRPGRSALQHLRLRDFCEKILERLEYPSRGRA